MPNNYFAVIGMNTQSNGYFYLFFERQAYATINGQFKFGKGVPSPENFRDKLKGGMTTERFPKSN
jgi:hypothetical protein